MRSRRTPVVMLSSSDREEDSNDGMLAAPPQPRTRRLSFDAPPASASILKSDDDNNNGTPRSGPLGLKSVQVTIGVGGDGSKKSSPRPSLDLDDGNDAEDKLVVDVLTRRASTGPPTSDRWYELRSPTLQEKASKNGARRRSYNMVEPTSLPDAMERNLEEAEEAERLQRSNSKSFLHHPEPRPPVLSALPSALSTRRKSQQQRSVRVITTDEKEEVEAAVKPNVGDGLLMPKRLSTVTANTSARIAGSPKFNIDSNTTLLAAMPAGAMYGTDSFGTFSQESIQHLAVSSNKLMDSRRRSADDGRKRSSVVNATTESSRRRSDVPHPDHPGHLMPQPRRLSAATQRRRSSNAELDYMSTAYLPHGRARRGSSSPYMAPAPPPSRSGGGSAVPDEFDGFDDLSGSARNVTPRQPSHTSPNEQSTRGSSPLSPNDQSILSTSGNFADPSKQRRGTSSKHSTDHAIRRAVRKLEFDEFQARTLTTEAEARAREAIVSDFREHCLTFLATFLSATPEVENARRTHIAADEAESRKRLYLDAAWSEDAARKTTAERERVASVYNATSEAENTLRQVVLASEEQEHLELVRRENVARQEVRRRVQARVGINLHQGCPFVHVHDCPFYDQDWVSQDNFRDVHRHTVGELKDLPYKRSTYIDYEKMKRERWAAFERPSKVRAANAAWKKRQEDAPSPKAEKTVLSAATAKGPVSPPPLRYSPTSPTPSVLSPAGSVPPSGRRQLF